MRSALTSEGTSVSRRVMTLLDSRGRIWLFEEFFSGTVHPESGTSFVPGGSRSRASYVLSMACSRTSELKDFSHFNVPVKAFIAIASDFSHSSNKCDAFVQILQV